MVVMRFDTLNAPRGRLRCNGGEIFTFLILHRTRRDQSRLVEAGGANAGARAQPNTICAIDSQKAVVKTAKAVAMVIWLEASAWPVPNCTAIR